MPRLINLKGMEFFDYELKSPITVEQDEAVILRVTAVKTTGNRTNFSTGTTASVINTLNDAVVSGPATVVNGTHFDFPLQLDESPNSRSIIVRTNTDQVILKGVLAVQNFDGSLEPVPVASGVSSFNGRAGVVVPESGDYSKGDVGLDNVDNTADADKPISTLQQAALDAKADLVSGKIPASQLPDIAVTEYLGAAANEAAMLTLLGEKGDWCTRVDLGTTWIITGNDPTQLASWTALSYPAAAVISVAGKTGAVTLEQSDIAGLVTALSGKADLSGAAFIGPVTVPTDGAAESAVNNTRLFLALSFYVEVATYASATGITVASWRTALGLGAWAYSANAAAARVALGAASVKEYSVVSTSIAPNGYSAYSLDATGDVTLTLDSWPADKFSEFTLVVTNGFSNTVTWPGSVTFVNDLNIDDDTAHEFEFWTNDGVNWKAAQLP